MDHGVFGKKDFKASLDEPMIKPTQNLPDDLPKSLDDRKNVPTYTVETEIYDAWQGR